MLSHRYAQMLYYGVVHCFQGFSSGARELRHHNEYNGDLAPIDLGSAEGGTEINWAPAVVSVNLDMDVVPMNSALDLCSLYRTLSEGFGRTEKEVSNQIDHRRRTRQRCFFPLCHPGFEPFLNPWPRQLIGLVLVVSSNVPDAELAVAAV